MVVVSKSAWGKDLNCTLYLDGYLKKHYLDQIPHMLDSDYDAWFVVFGEEGSGKTVDALTCAYYLDSNLSIDNVVFTQKGFEDAVDTLPPRSVLVWDEADKAAGHHADKQMQALKRKSKRIRKNNLSIILVQPTFLDYDKYFIYRFRFGLQPYDFPWKKQPSKQRGYAKVYNRYRLRKLHYDAKKANGDLSVGRPKGRVRFTDCTKRDGFPVPIGDGTLYDKKKQRATETLKEEEIITMKGFDENDVYQMLDYIKDVSDLKSFSKNLDCSYNTLMKRRSRLNKKEEVDS